MKFSDYGNTLTEQEVQDAFKKADGFNNIDNSNIFRTTWENGDLSVFVEKNNMMGYLDEHGDHGEVDTSPITFMYNFMIDKDGDDMPLHEISNFLQNKYGDEPFIYTCPYQPDVIWCLMGSIYRGYKVERISDHSYALSSGDAEWHSDHSYIWPE